MTKLRAKITPDGKIKSIGSGSELPHQLPEQINFNNYRFYTCLNMDDIENISSWTDEPVMVKEPEPVQEIMQDEKKQESTTKNRWAYQGFLLLIIITSLIHSINIAINGDSFNGVVGMVFSFCLVVLLLFDIFTSRN